MKLLLEQIKYNQWAVCKYLDAASQLKPDQLKQNMNSSFPSIIETLWHMLWAEELWLERWQGHTFSQMFVPGDYPVLEYIEKSFKKIHTKQIWFLAGIRSDQADRPVSYINFKGESWEYSLAQMVQHLLFHSAYHRGQLATMLRQMGIVPPSTDYLVYIDELLLTES